MKLDENQHKVLPVNIRANQINECWYGQKVISVTYLDNFISRHFFGAKDFAIGKIITAIGARKMSEIGRC